VKKACQFNLPTSYEFVFDHGYAGDTYGVNDIIDVFNATTSNRSPGSVHQDWTDSCTIDTIIYQRELDKLDQIIYDREHGFNQMVNKTETMKYQTQFVPTDQFER
jgi:hypothetical protein